MSVIAHVRDDKRAAKQAVCFLVASLCLHLLILFFTSSEFAKKIFSSQSVAVEKDKSTEIALIEIPIEEVKATRRMVDTALVEKSEKAKDKAFLGAQTQVVERETQAKNAAITKHQIAGGAPSKSVSKPTEPVKLGKLGVPMNFKPMGNLGPNAMPSQEAATSDYLKDQAQGAETLLNTKEFAFYSFYQRVRKQLEQFWEPGLMARLKTMQEKGRTLAAEQEHSTRVQVVMDVEGTIKKILVESTSGLVELDQAVIDAFNKAGPFPNPPKGMIKDGVVKIDWEFVLRT